MAFKTLELFWVVIFYQFWCFYFIQCPCSHQEDTSFAISSFYIQANRFNNKKCELIVAAYASVFVKWFWTFKKTNKTNLIKNNQTLKPFHKLYWNYWLPSEFQCIHSRSYRWNQEKIVMRIPAANIAARDFMLRNPGNLYIPEGWASNLHIPCHYVPFWML